MKVFLTGATGFVGSHVARTLLRHGHEVHTLVRPGADTWRIHDVVGELHPFGADLASPQLGEHLRALQPEVCLHLAWYAVPGRYLDAPENLDHLELGLRLARTLAQVGCRRFVGVGTCFEYAPSSAPLAEDALTAPTRLYSASKLAFAQLLPYAAAETGMSTAWARLFYVYGPFEDERRLVPSVIRSLMAGRAAQVSEGTQVRDYLHVADVAGALEAIARSPVQGPINVGSGRPETVRGLVLRIARLLRCENRVVFGAMTAAPGDPPHVCADNRRLLDEVRFEPRFDLDDGLRDSVERWSRRPDVEA